MNVNFYLFFNGNCESAFKYYAQHLGGKIDMMLTMADAPSDQSCDMPANSIMHARMMLGGLVVMGSDMPPSQFNEAQGFDVNISVDTPAEAERFFKVLSENGKIRMPLEETFWAQRFGSLVDQFGIPWMINCEKAG